MSFLIAPCYISVKAYHVGVQVDVSARPLPLMSQSSQVNQHCPYVPRFPAGEGNPLGEESSLKQR